MGKAFDCDDHELNLGQYGIVGCTLYSLRILVVYE